MATIITLQASRPDRPPLRQSRDGATILFFTGVRYVRDDAELDMGPAVEGDDDADHGKPAEAPAAAVN